MQAPFSAPHIRHRAHSDTPSYRGPVSASVACRPRADACLPLCMHDGGKGRGVQGTCPSVLQKHPRRGTEVRLPVLLS